MLFRSNTRDRLDQELISYKRLHTFSEQALREMSASGFHALVTESIVDIFEVEGSLLHFRNKNDNTTEFGSEGIDRKLTENQDFWLAIAAIEDRIEKDKVIVLEYQDFGNNPLTISFSRAMAARFSDPVTGCSLFIMGLVSREFDGLYPAFNSKNQTIFGIFLKQLQSF